MIRMIFVNYTKPYQKNALIDANQIRYFGNKIFRKENKK